MEKKEHPLIDLMAETMEKIHTMVDVNTIVGTPIQAGEVTIIPVSRVSFGFGAGGGDFAGKDAKPDADKNFGGGSGAGVGINPVAFLIVRGDSVKLMPVVPPDGAVDRVVDMVPELVDKITAFINEQQEKKKDNADF